MIHLEAIGKTAFICDKARQIKCGEKKSAMFCAFNLFVMPLEVKDHQQ